MAKITSVIELGSNSIRMSIFKRTSRYGYHISSSFKEKCPELLNQEVYDDLHMEAIHDILAELLEVSRTKGARKILIFATEAIRKSKNKNELVNYIYKRLNLKIKVIDDKKEAYFGALSAINNTKYEDFIVVDIGGGSTEVSIIKNREVVRSVSMKVGTLTLDDKKLLAQEAKKIRGFKSANLIVLNGSLLREIKQYLKKEDYLHLYAQTITKPNLKTMIKDSDSRLIKMLNLVLAKVTTRIMVREGGTREGYFLHDTFRKDKGILPKDCVVYTTTLLDMFDISKKRVAEMAKNANTVFEHTKEVLEIEDSVKPIFRDTAKLYLITEHIKDANTLRLLLLNHQFYRVAKDDLLIIASTIYYAEKGKFFRDDLNEKLIKKLSFLLHVVRILSSYKDLKFEMQKSSDENYDFIVKCDCNHKPILQKLIEDRKTYRVKAEFNNSKDLKNDRNYWA